MRRISILIALTIIVAVSATAQPADSARPLLSTSVTPEATPGDVAVWIGASRGGRWGGELGVRYRYIGFIVGTPDIGRGESVPEILDYEVPHGSYRTVKYEGGHNGFALLGFWDTSSWLALYGGGGFYWMSDVLVDRSTATGWYYKNSNSPDVHDGSFAAIAGVQLTLFRHLVVGGSYNTTSGAGVHLGGRW